MRTFVRLAVILGSVSGLAATGFAGIASAQGTHQHGSSAVGLGLPPEELAASIAHAATLGAIVFLAGLVAFVTLVWLPSNGVEDDDGGKAVDLLCRWMWVLVGLLVVAGLVEVSLYAVRASGKAFGLGLFEEALFDTRVGQLWVVKLALGIATATAATYAAQKLGGTGYRWGVAGVLSALLLATLTWQSHAAAEGGILPAAADWLHVAAASLWMGGLLGFPILLIGPLRAMPAEARAKLLGRVVPHFSKVTMIAVMSLILTGFVATLLHVPSLAALQSTAYGRALSVKLWLLLFLLGLGAWNLRLRGREPFGSVVRVELALAIGIFVATGFLTSTPPADSAQPTVENTAPNPAEDIRQPPMPPAPISLAEEEAVGNLVVRMSGTPGTLYSGVYGTGGRTQTADGALAAEPTDYEVKAEEGTAERGVSAAFEKVQPDEGTLKVEIMADGEVVSGRETSEESGTVAASWSPPAETAEEIF